MKIYKLLIGVLVLALVIVEACGHCIATTDLSVQVNAHKSHAVFTSHMNTGDMVFAHVDTQGQPVEMYWMDMDNYGKFMLAEDYNYKAYGAEMTNANGRMKATAPGKYVLLIVNKEGDQPINANVHLAYSRASSGSSQGVISGTTQGSPGSGAGTHAS